MNVLRVIVFEKENGKYGWRFVDKNDDTLAESPKEYETVSDALDDAALVTGLRFDFDQHGRYLGLVVFRAEPVGLTQPPPKLTPANPEPDPEPEPEPEPMPEPVDEPVEAPVATEPEQP